MMSLALETFVYLRPGYPTQSSRAPEESEAAEVAEGSWVSRAAPTQGSSSSSQKPQWGRWGHWNLLLAFQGASLLLQAPRGLGELSLCFQNSSFASKPFWPQTSMSQVGLSNPRALLSQHFQLLMAQQARESKEGSGCPGRSVWSQQGWLQPPCPALELGWEGAGCCQLL